MTSALTRPIAAAGIAALMGLALSGCSKLKQNSATDPAQSRTEAKRQQIACASSTAYDRVKNGIFDQAVRARNGDRVNLDMLADYSQARMEQPVVEGHDPVLDLTRCKGRFVLDIPPGAERGLRGERRLQAEINYSAQAAADGSGLVYNVDGAEPIVARLAAFNLSGLAYRPPPAIDSPTLSERVGGSTTMAQAEKPPAPSIAPPRPTPAAEQGPAPRAPQRVPGSQPSTENPQPAPPETPRALPVSAHGRSGESTVRAFYNALRQGDGRAASAQIIPEKRSSGAYSPGAMSQFYGRLPEPIRLTGILPLSNGAYRVRYAYSAGRSHCNGSAVVHLANRGGRSLISSIRALNGC